MSAERQMALGVPVQPMLGLAFINFVLVVLLMIVFFSFFAAPSGIEIRLPAEEGHTAEESRAGIRITSENVLFFNGKVVTFNELKRALAKIHLANTVVYIQVDRRASMGRVADVWDLCKGLGAARIKIAASQDQ